VKKQFAATLAARVASSFLQAGTFVLLARQLSIHDFGLLGAISSLAVIACTLADLGASTLIAKAQAAGQSSNVRALIQLNARSTIVAIALAAGFGILGDIAGVSPAWVAILACAILLEKNVETWLSIPIAEGHSLHVGANILFRRALPLGVVATTHSNVALAYSTAYLFSSILAQLHARVVSRRLIRDRLVGSPKPLRATLRMSLPYLVGNLTAHARYFDTAIVAAVGGASAAAIYAAGTKISNPLLLVPQTLAAILLPHATRMGTNFAFRTARVWLFLSFLLSAAACLLLPWGSTFASVLFGDAYADAGVIVVVTLAGLPLIAASSVLGSLLQSQEHAGFVAWNGILFAAILITAMWISALFGEGLGVALAVCLTYGLKSLGLFIRISRVSQPGATRARVGDEEPA
jgi:O-antigen/teichoic acid export membrane protein